MSDIETIQVPHAIIALALKRTDGLVKASFHDANVLRSIAISCYVQGLTDGYDGRPQGEERA